MASAMVSWPSLERMKSMKSFAALGWGASLTRARPKVSAMIGSAAIQSMGAPSFFSRSTPLGDAPRGDGPPASRNESLNQSVAGAKLNVLRRQLAQQVDDPGFAVIGHHAGHPFAFVFVHQHLPL